MHTIHVCLRKIQRGEYVHQSMPLFAIHTQSLFIPFDPCADLTNYVRTFFVYYPSPEAAHRQFLLAAAERTARRAAMLTSLCSICSVGRDRAGWLTGSGQGPQSGHKRKKAPTTDKPTSIPTVLNSSTVPGESLLLPQPLVRHWQEVSQSAVPRQLYAHSFRYSLS